MKVRYDEKRGKWVPDEPKDFSKILNNNITNLKRKCKLTFYTCWLWLYCFSYRYIKSDILGMKMRIGFEWLLVYKQMECDRFKRR